MDATPRASNDILMTAAFVLAALGFVGELIAAQRRVSEEVLVELRRRALEGRDD